MFFLILILLMHSSGFAMLSDWHNILDKSKDQQKDFFYKKIEGLRDQGKTIEQFMLEKYETRENEILADIVRCGFSSAVNQYKNFQIMKEDSLSIINLTPQLNPYYVSIIEKIARKYHLKGQLFIAYCPGYNNARANMVSTDMVDGCYVVENYIALNNELSNPHGTLTHEIAHILLEHAFRLASLVWNSQCYQVCPQAFGKLSHLHEFQADQFFAVKNINDACLMKSAVRSYVNTQECYTHPSGLDRYNDLCCIFYLHKAQKLYENNKMLGES